MLNAAENLRSCLKVKKEVPRKPSRNWWMAAKNFSLSTRWGASLVTLYPAGFQHGHTVRQEHIRFIDGLMT